MKKLFSIKQAAEASGMTCETLRHYDRIGLVKPCHVEEGSRYRYYSEQELVRLETVGLLRQMDMSLEEIKEILLKDDLAQVVALLKRAEAKAEEKMARLTHAKAKIQRARAEYEAKLEEGRTPGYGGEWAVRRLASRVILISDSLESPTLQNLWNYHSHFYRQVGTARSDEFAFEDLAGMITRRGETRLFAVCRKYPSMEGLTLLPEGDYLCGDCTEENRERVMGQMLEEARTKFAAEPPVILQNIVVVGILQWSYQIQMLLK